MKTHFDVGCSVVMVVCSMLVGIAGLCAQQPATPATPSPIKVNKTFSARFPVHRTLFAASAAPTGSPAPSITCILYMNTATPSEPHECKSETGGGSDNTVPSNECGTTCQEGASTPNTCSGTDDTDPDDCGSTTPAICTSDYSGCYPPSVPAGTVTPDPTTQNTDPDSYGDGDTPSSAAGFCSLVQNGLQKSCTGLPKAEQALCQYNACTKGNTCTGAVKQTCTKPPKGGTGKSSNDACQSQYMSNMSYCSKQTSLPTQNVCLATALAEMNGCTNLTSSREVQVHVQQGVDVH
jgi:hypothetical protein